MKHLLSSYIPLLGIFFLIYLNPSKIQNECEIGIVDVEILPCSENGYFSVSIDFDFANVGDEGFHVQGNGNNYGNFEYEALPVTINELFGDGQTEYEFVIFDNQFEDCTNWGGIDPVDCGAEDCWISELNIDDHSCDGGYYNVYLNFEYENVGDEGFKLWVNEDLFGEYDYEELPLNIGPFLGDGVTEYVFVVRDATIENCVGDKSFGPIDCSSSGCEIWDVEADLLDCNEGGFFAVAINFEYASVGEEGFRIQGNGTDYGDFEYENIPIIIDGLEGDGETIYEFVVIDNQFEDCSDWTAIDPVDCDGGDCFIGELLIDDYPCENGEYNVYLNFEYENIGESGFKLYVNWDLFGEYEYEDLPLNIGTFEGDGSTEYHFLVRDADFEDCATDKWFGPINCEEGECNIWDMTSTVLPCVDDDQFNVLLNFFYENVGDEGFKIQGNGNNYGTFDYDSLPIELGPFEANGDTEYEFEARDNQYEGCFDWTVIDPFDCDTITQIYDLNLEITDCAEFQYYLNVDFNYTNEGGEGFFIAGNGIEPQTFSYDNLPLKIGPLTNNQTTSYYFILRDKENAQFGNWQRFFPFNCDNLSVEESRKLLNLVNIYPVPSYGNITFDNLSNDNLEISLYNDKSQLMRTNIVTANNRVTVSNLESGLYFYTANTVNHTESGKFIVINNK